MLSEADAPGSLPDPVETRQTASSLDELAAWQDMPAAEIDPSKLEEAGFVSAIHETRFFPETPGDPHTRDARSRSDPCCPVRLGGRSAYRASTYCTRTPFSLARVAARRGSSRSTCPACPMRRACSAPSRPSDCRKRVKRASLPTRSRSRSPTAGSCYQLEGFGPPGSITEQQVEDIAKKLHDRVAGAPDLPESTSDCTAADRLWRGALTRRPTRWAMP